MAMAILHQEYLLFNLLSMIITINLAFNKWQDIINAPIFQHQLLID